MSQHASSTAAPTVRRRSRGGAPLEKRAFSLHANVIQEARAAVADGLAPNLSAFVEAAVIEKLRRSRRARLYEAYAVAANDPAFMADMEQLTTAYDATAADGL
ncbi:hypothetical protein [Gemmatimonas sp.]|uniref:hypothetical protein n=1 Tax=Gemmatimonas sp. TaxID=1962908 RepID=UPI0025C702ED|nr:hypothetical protein [Gemmatimonas sp.]MCA2987093.1 hypothetical protein [Gemmatimonas sp.]MCA2996532.1 hypothetical protein [Gemmatimonas sp.]